MDQPHQQASVLDSSSVPKGKDPAASQLKLSIITTPRIPDDGLSEHKYVSARHANSVVYGDEVISIEEELKYPYPHEELPLLSAGACAKGPLFNRNTHPKFF